MALAASSSVTSARSVARRASVDLLHWGPARIAVSFNVENPRDYPEHLVDGVGFIVPRNAELQSAPCEPGCMDDMLRVETRLEKVEAEAGNIALHVRQTSASSEANDEQGTHTTATDTRWLTLRSPLGTAPVTCARLETKTSCSLRGKDVAWGRAVDLDARYRTT